MCKQQKPSRSLRRKISNAIRSNRYFCAVAWVTKDKQLHWHIATEQFPFRGLLTVTKSIREYTDNELQKNSLKKS